MSNRLALPLIAAGLLSGVLAAGCGGDADSAPVFRNPVTLADADLATQALRIIGAPIAGTGNQCQTCHGITKARLHQWAAATTTALTECITDPLLETQASAQATLDCFRHVPNDPGSSFDVDRFGPLTAAARLPWFQYAIARAYDGDEQAVAEAAFENLVAMPHDVHAAPQLTQEEFDIVAEYFARGAPMADQLITDPDPVDACIDEFSPTLTSHVAALQTTGWRQVNADNHLDMFGCAAGQTGVQCLQDRPAASTTAYGAAWDVDGLGPIRVLKELAGYRSSFWTRSSPDGRFVAHGGGNSGSSATIIDLQRDALVGIGAFYDPTFFPDNTGFIFQGTGNNSCSMAVLTDLTGTGGAIDNDHDHRCANLGAVGLYQHVGRVLGNGDYFAVSGEFVSDDGGHEATFTNPDTFFGSTATALLTPIVFDGTRYQDRQPVQIPIPFEGDAVISPSMSLLANRVSGGAGQNGYALRTITLSPDGNGSYNIGSRRVGRLCEAGGKPAFSYDERWLVYHHYIDPTRDSEAIELGFTGTSDPGFAGYIAQGATNLYLVDLISGARYRITNMQPGQYVLFPHFRSDGWIYAEVRAPFDGNEYPIASPAALIKEAR